MLVARHFNFLRKAVLFGFVGFILVAVFSCGMFQTLGNHGGIGAVECDVVASVIGGVSVRDFALYAALFAIVASLLLVFGRQTYQKVLAPVLSVTLASRFKEQQLLLTNFLIEAFRKGVIHPQVYNNTFN